MKKAKPAKSRTGTKRTATPKKRTAKTAPAKRAAKAEPQTVEQYIAAAPVSARAALEQIRKAIRSVVPAEATEIISYKIPAFKHKTVLVWYAAFTGHYSIFPTAAIIEQFKDDLNGYSTSKGTVHFPADKPLPLALIKKMVKARLARSDT